MNARNVGQVPAKLPGSQKVALASYAKFDVLFAGSQCKLKFATM